MIGDNKNGSNPLSNYLINFNAANWANQANAQLQSGLNQGLQYNTAAAQQGANALQAYSNQANQNLNQGFQQSQALNAPQHLATYNALDAYQNTLGLPTPVGGSFQLAQAMQKQATGQPATNPQQQQMAAGYNNGLLS